MITEKEKRKYIKAVSKRINCSKQDKEKCIVSLNKSIDEITQYDEDASLDLLGPAEEVAKEYEMSLAEDIILKHKKKTRIIRTALVILCIAIFLVLTYTVYYQMSHPDVTYVYTEPATMISELTLEGELT